MNRLKYTHTMLYKLIIIGALCFESASITFAQLGNHVPAFPGAEGYGARTQGGRGGKALYVTNLNENGPGSLRAACEAEGPRMVLFKVAGTIPGDIRIANDFITIAGQTAPGEGITLKGNLSVQANDVIVRYLRVRSDGDGDAISGRYKKNIIFDHVSASWGGDEVMSIYHCETKAENNINTLTGSPSKVGQ